MFDDFTTQIQSDELTVILGLDNLEDEEYGPIV